MHASLRKRNSCFKLIFEGVDDLLYPIHILPSIVDLGGVFLYPSECLIELYLHLLKQLFAAVHLKLVSHTEILKVDLEAELELQIAKDGLVCMAQFTPDFATVQRLDLLWFEANYEAVKYLADLQIGNHKALTILALATYEHEIVGTPRLLVEIPVVFAANQHPLILLLQLAFLL